MFWTTFDIAMLIENNTKYEKQHQIWILEQTQDLDAFFFWNT